MFKYCPFCGAEIENSTEFSFQCQSCGKKYFYNSKPTVGIVPIFKNEMLLAIRAVEPDKGSLDTIGGFLEYGEEPLDGALREFKEETGKEISKENLKFLGIVMCHYFYQEISYSILNIIYTIDFAERPEFNPQDDVADLVWLNLNEKEFSAPLTDYMNKIIKLIDTYRPS